VLLEVRRMDRPRMDWALGKRRRRKKVDRSPRGEEEGMAADGEEGGLALIR
jgi:hypothetical protein